MHVTCNTKGRLRSVLIFNVKWTFKKLLSASGHSCFHSFLIRDLCLFCFSYQGVQAFRTYSVLELPFQIAEVTSAVS